MQDALHRSGLVPRGFSADYEGDIAVITVRACGSFSGSPLCRTARTKFASRLTH